MNTEDEIASLKEEIARLKEDVWMANACLDQMREWLAIHGIDVKHTPPMYYPEACQSVLVRLVEKQRADDEIKFLEVIDYEHITSGEKKWATLKRQK